MTGSGQAVKLLIPLKELKRSWRHDSWRYCVGENKKLPVLVFLKRATGKNRRYALGLANPTFRTACAHIAGPAVLHQFSSTTPRPPIPSHRSPSISPPKTSNDISPSWTAAAPSRPRTVTTRIPPGTAPARPSISWRRSALSAGRPRSDERRSGPARSAAT